MAKKSKNKNNVLFGVLAIVFAIVAMVATCFPISVTSNTKIMGIELDEPMTSDKGFTDWFNYVTSMVQNESETIWGWAIAKILMIATLIVVILVLFTQIAKFFVKNKGFSKISLYLAVVGLCVGALYLVAFLVGCFVQTENNSLLTVYQLPHVGGILIGVGAIISSFCATKA